MECWRKGEEGKREHRTNKKKYKIQKNWIQKLRRKKKKKRRQAILPYHLHVGQVLLRQPPLHKKLLLLMTYLTAVEGCFVQRTELRKHVQFCTCVRIFCKIYNSRRLCQEQLEAKTVPPPPRTPVESMLSLLLVLLLQNLDSTGVLGGGGWFLLLAVHDTIFVSCRFYRRF